jgi:hypothetical protein
MEELRVMGQNAGWGSEKTRQAWLAKAVQFQPDAETCQACLEHLDEYIAAQLAGERYVERYPEIALHLDACLECASAYARLYEIEVAAEEGLPQPKYIPAPDLSFLSTHNTSPDPISNWIDRLRSSIQRTGDQLVFQLSSELLSWLRPLPVLATTRSAGSEQYGEVLLALEPDEELQAEIPFRLNVCRDAYQPDHCLVEVTVAPVGRSWPELGDIPVSLTVGGQVHQAMTDAWGLACFEAIAIRDLDQMRVEITLPPE